MVLEAFWGSLGLLFGVLGGFLGAFWLVLGAPWELQVAPENFENDSGALLGFFLLSSLSFFSLLHPLTASKWFFIFFSGLFFSSWSFSRLILSSQDGPLSVKNLDLAKTFDELCQSTFSIRTFLLRAFWGSLRLMFGARRSFLGAFWVVLGAPWELQVAPQLL